MNNPTVKSKEEFWKLHVTQFNKSGLNRRQYCTAENLSYWTFRDWQKKLDAVLNNEKFIKISHRTHPKINEPQSAIEIIVSQKISIRLTHGFDGELLRNVISELGVRL